MDTCTDAAVVSFLMLYLRCERHATECWDSVCVIKHRFYFHPSSGDIDQFTIMIKVPYMNPSTPLAI